MKYLYIFIFLFAFNILNAADIEIDPAQLKPQWWDQFSAAPGKVKEKSAPLIKKIESVIPTMTESEKIEATELLQRINVNLGALEKAEKAPPLFVPPVTPVSSTYPLDEVLEIARKIQSDTLRLKNLKDERQDKLSQIDAVQTQMDKLAKVYFKSNEQNEERFNLGLKLISYQITMAVAKDDLARLDNGILGYETYLKRLEEEVDAAEHRIVATPEELSKVRLDRDTALKEWDAAVQSLKQKEAEHISVSGPGENEAENAAGQLHDQQMVQAFLTEMDAHQKYLSLEIKASLLQLILNPAESNLNTIDQLSRGWARTLSDISRRSGNFSKSADRQMQRTGQLLSLNTGDDKNSYKREIQQKIIQVAQTNLLSVQKLNSEGEDARFMLTKLDANVNTQLGGSKRFGQIITGYISSFWEVITDWFDTPLFHVGAKPIQLSSLIKFISILLLTFWGSAKIIEWINRLATSRKGIEKALLYRITRLAYYVLLMIGGIIALTSIGFDLSSFLLVAGALGVGLGFGLQSIFQNFLSGLILLFESNIKVGDFIEMASGVRGEVREINVRSTIVASADGTDMIIPNSEIVNSRVVNWTLTHPYRKIRIPFVVAYGSDKDLVRRIIIEGTTKVPETLIKPGFSDPSVILTAFGPVGLEFDLNVWVNEKFSKRPGQSISDYLWMIDNTLKEHQVVIPFPRTDFRII